MIYLELIAVLLIAAAFFGARMILHPTEQFVYAKDPAERSVSSSGWRNILGLFLCVGAIILLLVMFKFNI